MTPTLEDLMGRPSLQAPVVVCYPGAELDGTHRDAFRRTLARGMETARDAGAVDALQTSLDLLLLALDDDAFDGCLVVARGGGDVPFVWAVPLPRVQEPYLFVGADLPRWLIRHLAGSGGARGVSRGGGRASPLRPRPS